MISVPDALSILSEYVPERSSETVSLNDALWRVCAEDVSAKVTLPPRDASAMDGYAVRLQDVQNAGVTLDIIGDVPAGAVFDGTVAQGETVRLFTGSPVPKGADHIIIQENTVRSGNAVKIIIGSDGPEYIRRAGIDFTKGDVIVPRLTELGPPEIALAAAGNQSHLKVLTKLRVSILAAGDELVQPGEAMALGDVVNANTSALSALIKTWGGTVTDIGLTRDNPNAILDMFERAKSSDIIVPVGGASVGDHDHMRRVFKDMGGKMVFEKIAVKPGKPTWFGTLEGKAVLGLPGNPASAMVCAHLFLSHLMGRAAKVSAKAQLETSLSGNGPRETYLRARLSCREGQLYVKPFPRQDSSLLSPFRGANVLLRRLPNAEPAPEGELVDVIPLGTGPDLLASF